MPLNLLPGDRDLRFVDVDFIRSSIKRVGSELCVFHSLVATQVDYKTPAVYSSGPSVYRRLLEEQTSRSKYLDQCKFYTWQVCIHKSLMAGCLFAFICILCESLDVLFAQCLLLYIQ
jgi:hypothetical protein